MGGSVEFLLSSRDSPGLIFLRPTANPAPRNVVFLHATEPFGGLKVLVALFRKVGAWNIQVCIPSSGFFLPRRGYAASCALRRSPCCAGASRERFAYPVSSPFAIRTAQRWRSPKLRMPRRPGE